MEKTYYATGPNRGNQDGIYRFVSVKTVLWTFVLDSCQELFRQFQILTLPGLYIHQCLTYIKTHELKFPAVNSRHNYNTRHGENLLLPQHRLTLTDKSYINIAIKLFNALPHYIKILPIIKFKGQTKWLIMEKFISSEYLKNWIKLGLKKKPLESFLFQSYFGFTY